MSIEVGKYYPVIASASQWMIAPMCDSNSMKYGLMVRAGDGNLFWRCRIPETVDSDFINIETGSENVMLPLGCHEEGCEGNDLLCDICPCESKLSERYIVSISGMPEICGVEEFNGVWTLEYVGYCHWVYSIDPWRSVHLNTLPGPFWRLSWQVSAPGGLSGYFGGYGDASDGCIPQNLGYYPMYCTAPGCAGLCGTFFSTATAVVDIP